MSFESVFRGIRGINQTTFPGEEAEWKRFDEHRYNYLRECSPEMKKKLAALIYGDQK